MATIRRRNKKLQVLIDGEVIMDCDSLDEVRHWLDILGMTAEVRFA